MDRRRIPVRHDLAAEHLRGEVEVEKFVEGTPMQVGVSLLNLVTNADPNTSMATQLLFGEGFTVYDQIPEMGLSWGQSDRDGYVGYLATEGLTPPAREGLTQITVPSALVYGKPDMKTRPIGAYSLGSRVPIGGDENGFAQLGERMYTPLVYFKSVDTDFVAVAETFVGVPYLWGGRSSFGLDCSALVQLSLMAVGVDVPRDSDMQAAEVGEPSSDTLRRGDLVFWDGHIGIMQSSDQILHANAHHMAVTSELLVDVIARADGPVTAQRRL